MMPALIRRCYRHPDNATCCVKVYRTLESVPKSDQMKRWRIWLGNKYLRYNMNHYVFLFWQELTKGYDIDDLFRNYFPHMDDLVETNCGLGLVQELLISRYGKPAKTLAQQINTMSRAELDNVCEQIYHLSAHILKRAAPIYD